MPYQLNLLGLLSLLVLFISACNEESEDPDNQLQNVHSLPMNRIPLDDLTAFRSPGGNWSIVGNVLSDYKAESDMQVVDGDGILFNLPTNEYQENLFTELEHGDIELKLEFLIPKGSNSGIYFQGRYEVQILDSWQVSEPEFSDVGGIYEQWDDSRPDGQKGHEGKAPDVNASLAPGLWQEYRILFRAPRFDSSGEKIENARFEEVYLNGALIHKNVEVTGPTRAAAFEDEVEKGPLMLQGDHGPVAFRNIEYKLYEQTDSLELSPLTYKIYDYSGDRTPKSFDDLELLKEGTTDSFSVAGISPKNEHFATRLTGELYVPISGDYLFETLLYPGGNLYIDGELILENTGELEGFRPGKIIYLEEGTHQLDVTQFKITWGTHSTIYYEGPKIEKRTLASKATWGGTNDSEPLTVSPESNQPEIIGGFTNYGGEKRTHTLSIGFEEGIHYSYDLQSGALLKFWRDPFADLSRMWVDRGHEQLLVPMNAAVEEMAGSPLLLSDSDNQFFNSDNEILEYTMTDDGKPVFRSNNERVTVVDFIRPEAEGPGLKRTLTFSSDEAVNDASARLAQNQSIEELSESFYRIGGRYYLEILKNGGETANIMELNNSEKALIVPVLQGSNQTEIEYRLLW